MADQVPEFTTELYSLLGEFTVEFEWFCFFMRNSIRYMARLVGNNNEIISKALTTEMNAMPLLRAFRSIAMNVRPLSETEKAIITRIYKQSKSLVEDRNNLVHGIWFAREPLEGQESQAWATGHKSRHTTNGVEESYFVLSVEKFRPLIDECKKASGNVSMLSLALGEPDISPHFRTDQDASISMNPTRPMTHIGEQEK